MTTAPVSAQPRKGLHIKAGLFALLALGSLLPSGCSPAGAVLELSGMTMGTGYSVQVAASLTTDALKQLHADIESELVWLDQGVFSTWATESQVSRFNRLPVNGIQTVSPEFISLLQLADSIREKSGGIFDITVAPLVELWGFGPGPEPSTVPDDMTIQHFLQQTGSGGIKVHDGGRLEKLAHRQLDFSGIAKGFAVDRLGSLLESAGVTDYLVEIGGEVLASGTRRPGEPWRVAIETPSNGDRSAVLVISTRGSRVAVAGSGTYRNFIEIDGIRYAHEIDPRTGYPARNALLAVTVLHESAAEADAWATAFMVAGGPQALELAEIHDLGLLIQSGEGDGIVPSYNAAFAHYLEQ